MKTKSIRILPLLLTLVVVFVTLAPVTSLADTISAKPIETLEAVYNEDTEKEVMTKGSVWLTGRFNGNSWSSSHRVYTNNSYSTPKFRVFTYNANGSGTSGKFHIKVTTPQDRYYVKYYYYRTSGDTISLDKGYSRYDISICRAYTNSTNVSRTYYWAFKATQNGSWAW